MPVPIFPADFPDFSLSDFSLALLREILIVQREQLAISRANAERDENARRGSEREREDRLELNRTLQANYAEQIRAYAQSLEENRAIYEAKLRAYAQSRAYEQILEDHKESLKHPPHRACPDFARFAIPTVQGCKRATGVGWC